MPERSVPRFLSTSRKKYHPEKSENLSPDKCLDLGSGLGLGPGQISGGQVQGCGGQMNLATGSRLPESVPRFFLSFALRFKLVLKFSPEAFPWTPSYALAVGGRIRICSFNPARMPHRQILDHHPTLRTHPVRQCLTLIK